jgi:protein transport protein SEC61 subunit gamma and related proteins
MHEQLAKRGKVKRFLKETMRVLRVTKKPNRTEFMSITKVTGLGIVIIGIVGFVIFMIKQVLF